MGQPENQRVEWVEALAATDPRAALARLQKLSREDMARLLPGTTPPMPAGAMALGVVLDQVKQPGEWEAWRPVAQALVDKGAALVPPTARPVITGLHPLLVALEHGQDPVLEWALGHLRPSDRACLPAWRTRVRGHAVNLLECALFLGRAHAARTLWKREGLAPSFSTLARPNAAKPKVHSDGALVLACVARPSPQMEKLILELLEACPWPQHDLDQALRAALPHPDTVDRYRPRPTSLAVVQALLDAGANPASLATDELPPLATTIAACPVASNPFTPGVVPALLAAGARLDTLVDAWRNYDGPLSMVVPCNPSHAMGWGLSAVQPLGLAALVANPELVEELLAAGADIHHATSAGQTALHLACANPRPTLYNAQVVARLLDAGADPSACDHKGRTALEMWVETHKKQPGAIFPPQVIAAARELLHRTLAARPQAGPRVFDLLQCRQVLSDPILAAWHAAIGPALEASKLQAILPPSPGKLPRTRM